ncbi:MAG: ATP-binding protein [Nocardiopsaceae bacterium]|nr:ATP-binding protein [Nocardiopsaceae bacterium]
MNEVEALDGDVRFCLVLPSEALSVPVMRRVLGGTLLGFGADEECVAEILLAATEACTNVLKHDPRSGEYEVSASVGKNDCFLEIANASPSNGSKSVRRLNVQSFRGGLRLRPWRSAARAEPDVPLSAPTEAEHDLSQIAESGRGLTIMRACVDDLTLRGTAARGTVVSMRKQITWAPDVNGRHAGGRPSPNGTQDTAALRQAG